MSLPGKRTSVRLNKELRELEAWNADTISARSRRLAEEAIEIWSFPSATEYVTVKMRNLAKNKESVYSLEDYPHLTDEMLLLFNELRKRICNLDSSVREEYKKRYIVFKTASNFASIIPQKAS